MKLYNSLSLALKERSQVRAIKLTLKGPWPKELSDLPLLQEAYLEGQCESLPPELAGLKNLKLLSLKLSGLKGDLRALFNLPQLETLKILQTPLKTLHLPLGTLLSPLRSLTLKDCALQELPEEISALTHLEVLELAENQLTQLPLSFSHLKNLKRLNLDHNQFKKFPDHIKKIPSLTHLSIDENLFDDEERARIQREFHLWVK
jgi:Leucine-rich repeat (LRR) protein